MAKARTAKKAKKKTTKKKVTKKTAKKAAKKVAKKKTAASPRKTTTRKTGKSPALAASYNGTDKITLASVYKSIDFLRIEVAELKDLLLGKEPTAKTANTPDPMQPSLFDNPPAQTANGETSFTKEDIAQALQEVLTIAGQDKVKEILDAHKAARVSAIKEADYPSVFTACKEITDGPEGASQTKEQPAANSATSIF